MDEQLTTINSIIDDKNLSKSELHKDLTDNYGIEIDYQRLCKLLDGTYKKVKKEEAKAFEMFITAKTKIEKKGGKVVKALERLASANLAAKGRMLYKYGVSGRFDKTTLQRIGKEMIAFEKEIKELLT